MNLIFNEVSFQPHIENDVILKEKFLGLLNLFEFARNNYGFTHIVFPENIGELKVTDEKTFYQWVYSIAHTGDKNKILSVVKKPFSKDILKEKTSELYGYYYENLEIGIPQTYCDGLAIAHIKQELSSSLIIHNVWEENSVRFKKIINDESETVEVEVLNVGVIDDFKVEAISQFIEYLGNLELIETELNIENKSVELRDDHGKDKLLAFSNKVLKSKYVLCVINSLPFNPKAVNLIHKVYNDGKIEMVLYREDNGIGIIIQTTGRNYRETEEIARILKKEFDK